MDDRPPRLTSAMLVSALIRRVQAEGGFAAVLRRGDADAGAILIECADRGQPQLTLEQATGLDGKAGWRLIADRMAGDAEGHRERLQKRLRLDPDLWIVELDIAEAERFAAETIGSA
jgi:hypothetical protein